MRRMFLMAQTALLIACASAAGQHRVETLELQQYTGKLTSIADGTVTLRNSAGPRKVPLSQVTRLVISEEVRDLLARANRAAVITAAGDRLAGRSLTASDGKVRLQSRLLGEVTLDLADVSVIYLPTVQHAPRQIEQRCRQLKLTDAPGDVLVVARDADDWLGVPGVFQALGEQRVTFRWQGTDRRIKRSQVRAIRLAAIEQRSYPANGRLVARDGSVLAVKSIRYAPGRFRAETTLLAAQTLPATEVASVHLNPRGMVELGSLPADEVTEQGFFEQTYTYRVGRSVSGGPLRLDGKTYDAGLGLHSYCEMTWKLDGRFRQFVALVGIDDAVRPIGDADVTFLADGKPLAEPLRVTGQDPARVVRLDVSGANTFTVRVAFGQDGLDAGDHVNLALARLIP